jgi:uncharacterized membrane protein (DUF485 family)
MLEKMVSHFGHSTSEPTLVNSILMLHSYILFVFLADFSQELPLPSARFTNIAITCTEETRTFNYTHAKFWLTFVVTVPYENHSITTMELCVQFKEHAVCILLFYQVQQKFYISKHLYV